MLANTLIHNYAVLQLFVNKVKEVVHDIKVDRPVNKTKCHNAILKKKISEVHNAHIIHPEI